MSEIMVAGLDGMIDTVRVYDLDESVAASKFPMAVAPDADNSEITKRTVNLAQAEPGSGHDNFLQGIRIAFNIRLTAKCLVELERYHFTDMVVDIVSCTSTMHRISKFDLDSAYNDYTDKRIIGIMAELAEQYNANKTDENYLRLLYSNPAGFEYTLRVTTNYRQLKTIYAQRKAHRLPEWRALCLWMETLPHSEFITGEAKDK